MKTIQVLLVNNLIMNLKYILKICQEDGCWSRYTTGCLLPDYEESRNGRPDYFYCAQHAHKNGFCWMCGQFWAGIESFDFLSTSGLCENCLSLSVGWEENEYDDEYGDDFDYEGNR